MLSFVNLVIDRYVIGQNEVRVAFVRYADQANVVFNLNQYTDANSLKAAVNAVQLLNGGSNLAVALDTLRTQVFGSSAARQSVWKVAIVITDQLQGSAALTTAIHNVKSAGIRVYGVGIQGVTGRQMNITTLYALSYQRDQNNHGRQRSSAATAVLVCPIMFSHFSTILASVGILSLQQPIRQHNRVSTAKLLLLAVSYIGTEFQFDVVWFKSVS